MRLLRCMFVNFAVTAIAEDLFGGDALLLDDPDSVNNSYDLIDVPAGVPDFSFTAADSASPESDMFASSCLPSDPDPQLLSRVRVRVRDDAKVCAPNTLPSVSVPNFQDLQQGVWNILDQPAVDDKKTTNPNPESIPGRGAPILVSPEDPANCRPEKPYRLCCIGAGNPIEIDLLSNPVYTLFRRCELGMLFTLPPFCPKVFLPASILTNSIVYSSQRLLPKP